MATLIIGLVLFIGIHLLTAVPALRSPVVARMGEWPWKGVVALVSLLGLILAGRGYSRAGVEVVWEPLPFGHELAAAMMPVATLLFVAAYLPGNIKRLTAHPMLWAVVLWGVAHLLVRGHWAAVVLFGGLGLYALAAMALARWRGVRPSALQRPVWQDLLVVGVGLAVYALLLILHPILFGVAVIA